MKRSISTLLTTLLLFTAILPVAAKAQTTDTLQTSFNPYAANQAENWVRPFNLAFLAYQGYLKSQGIPSSGALLEGIQTGTITSGEILQAAIKAHQLPEKILSDQVYRNALESELQGLAAD